MKRIIYLVIASLFFYMACKKKEQPEIDTEKISRVQINVKIKEYLDRAARENDDNKRARLLGAASEMLAEKGDYKKAAQVARRAKRANPSQKQALATIGEYYIHQGKYKEAQVVLSEALLSDEKYGRANYLMGNSFYGLGDYDESERYFLMAVKYSPDDIRSYNNLAKVYMKRSRLIQALGILKKGISQNPEFALTYKNAGIVAEKLNKKGEALEYYKKFVSLNPDGDDGEVVKQWIVNLSQK